MAKRHNLPRVCVALGFDDVRKLMEHARREAEGGERFLEFRLDYLASPQTGVDAISQFLAESPECTVLATCRRKQNHGHFTGSIEQQFQVLDAALRAGARAVDVEIETAEISPDRLDALRSRATLVVSYHNFEATPVLEPVVRRMQRVPADIYKIVTMAKKPSDNGRVLSLLKGARGSLVVLAMGESGLPTRILSTALGGAFTYAAPCSAHGTAPGQIPGRQLRQMYRVDRIAKSTKVYGVIADPVHHSISPAVHNRAFQSRRIDAVYLPFLVQQGMLRDFVTFAGSHPVSGFSVTIPHKQRILRYLENIDPVARRIGAVNTVWKRAGRWRGSNTDIQGVTVPLSKHVRLSKASVLVAGNGGAARAAAFALADAGAQVTIAARNLDRARLLARACGAAVLSVDHAEKASFDALVHATPLGMSPNVDGCFFRERVPAAAVLDMVYNPRETKLLKLAAAQGAVCIAGVDMFLEQAAHQFELWTGESAPRAAMEKAAVEALEIHHAGS